MGFTWSTFKGSGSKGQIISKIIFIEWLVNVNNLLSKKSCKVKTNIQKNLGKFQNNRHSGLLRKASTFQVYNQYFEADAEGNNHSFLNVQVPSSDPKY